MQKVVITGASGFLGYHLYNALPDNILPIGIYYRNIPQFQERLLYPCNLCDQQQLEQLLNDIQPDAIIHTAAISDSNYCELHPAESYAVNVTATRYLSDYAAARSIPFLFTSTDLVFDGKKGNYTEEDLPNPIMEYGRQKREAEEYIAEKNPAALIVRLPLLYGALHAGEKNYFVQTINKLKNNEPVFLFDDEYRSMADSCTVAKNCWQLLFKEKGIFHLAGNERLSRFAFGKKIAEIYDFDENLLIAKKQSEMTFAAPRPADVSMSNQKAKNAGCTFDDTLDALYNIYLMKPFY